jgi:hypothetical protein
MTHCATLCYNVSHVSGSLTQTGFALVCRPLTLFNKYISGLLQAYTFELKHFANLGAVSGHTVVSRCMLVIWMSQPGASRNVFPTACRSRCRAPCLWLVRIMAAAAICCSQSAMGIKLPGSVVHHFSVQKYTSHSINWLRRQTVHIQRFISNHPELHLQCCGWPLRLWICIAHVPVKHPSIARLPIPLWCVPSTFDIRMLNSWDVASCCGGQRQSIAWFVEPLITRTNLAMIYSIRSHAHRWLELVPCHLCFRPLSL